MRKVLSAHGGFLGARSRIWTGPAPKCHGEPQAGGEPWMAEWGNPLSVMGQHPYLNP